MVIQEKGNTTASIIKCFSFFLYMIFLQVREVSMHEAVLFNPTFLVLNILSDKYKNSSREYRHAV